MYRNGLLALLILILLQQNSSSDSGTQYVERNYPGYKARLIIELKDSKFLQIKLTLFCLSSSCVNNCLSHLMHQ